MAIWVFVSIQVEITGKMKLFFATIENVDYTTFSISIRAHDSPISFWKALGCLFTCLKDLLNFR
jgi:hypothetical protein